MRRRGTTSDAPQTCPPPPCAVQSGPRLPTDCLPTSPARRLVSKQGVAVATSRQRRRDVRGVASALCSLCVPLPDQVAATTQRTNTRSSGYASASVISGKCVSERAQRMAGSRATHKRGARERRSNENEMRTAARGTASLRAPACALACALAPASECASLIPTHLVSPAAWHHQAPVATETERLRVAQACTAAPAVVSAPSRRAPP